MYSCANLTCFVALSRSSVKKMDRIHARLSALRVQIRASDPLIVELFA